MATVTLGLAACETTEGTFALGAIGATLLGSQAPTHEIEQIYYLGSFDPQGQLPPEVYRVRVHGQASFISQMSFASGWLRANLVDSLGTTVRFEKQGGRAITDKGADDELTQIQTGRRLIQFGPEGFREVPKDHRLVIVMGATPEKFFQAMDEVLGAVSDSAEAQRENTLTRELFEALVHLQAQGSRLGDLEKDVATELKQ